MNARRRPIPLRICLFVFFFVGFFGDRALSTSGQREMITVVLKATDSGLLASIQIQISDPITGADMHKQLHDHVVRISQEARTAGQDGPDICLRIDDRLRFQEVARVLLLLESMTSDDGKVVPLAEHIRLETQGFSVGINDEWLKYLEQQSRDRMQIRFDSPQRRYPEKTKPVPLGTVPGEPPSLREP